MASSSDWVGAKELAELDRLTRAQVEAAHAADVEGLTGLLAARRALLEALRGRTVRPGEAAQLTRLDAEARRSVEAHIQRVQGELATIRVGGRALRSYETRVPAWPGFIDECR